MRDRNGEPRAPPRPRRASSSCRRTRAPSPAARPRAPPRSPAASARRRRCAGRAGTPAPAARAPRRRPAESSRSQCWPVCSVTSSMPASRSATASGPDLMNCGRLPTTERTFTSARLQCRRLPGPLAQLVEQGTLNPKVEGSNPSRPIEVFADRRKPHGYAGQTCHRCHERTWRAPPGAPPANMRFCGLDNKGLTRVRRAVRRACSGRRTENGRSGLRAGGPRTADLVSAYPETIGPTPCRRRRP